MLFSFYSFPLGAWAEDGENGIGDAGGTSPAPVLEEPAEPSEPGEYPAEPQVSLYTEVGAQPQEAYGLTIRFEADPNPEQLEYPESVQAIGEGDSFTYPAPAIAGYEPSGIEVMISGKWVDPAAAGISLGTGGSDFPITGTMPDGDTVIVVKYKATATSFTAHYFFQKLSEDGTLGYVEDAAYKHVYEGREPGASIPAKDVLLGSGGNAEIPVGYYLAPGTPTGDGSVGTVVPNGKTSINLYYNLKNYSVQFHARDGELKGTPGKDSLLSGIGGVFGERRTVTTTPPVPVAPAGSVHFAGWYLSEADAIAVENGETGIPSIAEVVFGYRADTGFTEPATTAEGQNLQLYAAWTKADQIVYRVNYYLRDIGKTGAKADDYSLAETSAEGYSARYDDKDALTWETLPEGAQKGFTGFTHDKTGAALDGLVYNEDGSWTYNAYYTRNTYTLKAYRWIWAVGQILDQGDGTRYTNHPITLTFEYGAPTDRFWIQQGADNRPWSTERNKSGEVQTQTRGQYTIPAVMPDPATVNDDDPPGMTADDDARTLTIWEYMTGLSTGLSVHASVDIYVENVSGAFEPDQESPRRVTFRTSQLPGFAPQEGAAPYPLPDEADLASALAPFREETMPGFYLVTEGENASSTEFAPNVDAGQRHGYFRVSSSEWGAKLTPAFTARLYYERKTTTVNFWVGDRPEGTPYATLSGKYETPVPLDKVAAPHRDGYTFAGWYTKPAESGSAPASIATFPSASVTDVYAKWEAASYYTVIFDYGWEGAKPSQNSLIVTPGLILGGENPIGAAYWDAENPRFPAREGYTFTGWYADGASTPFDFAVTPIWNNITLHARWAGPVSYTIHYVKLDAQGELDGPYAEDIVISGEISNLAIALAQPPGQRLAPGVEAGDYLPTEQAKMFTFEPGGGELTFYFRLKGAIPYKVEALLSTMSGEKVLDSVDGYTENSMVLVSALDFDSEELKGFALAPGQPVARMESVDLSPGADNVYQFYFAPIQEEAPVNSEDGQNPPSQGGGDEGGNGGGNEGDDSPTPENPGADRNAGAQAEASSGTSSSGGGGIADFGGARVPTAVLPVITLPIMDADGNVIEPADTPLASLLPIGAIDALLPLSQGEGGWSLLNLALMIFTAAMAAILLMRWIRSWRLYEGDHIWAPAVFRMATVVVTAASVILFGLTGDMANPSSVRLTDAYTAWFVGLAITQVILCHFARKAAADARI
ncbi:MAG: InlB B-repeat-containing protein [Clostridiales Family XIII bacterium]|jgi:uncharacterized repeat protein (TIGR02543 family)|nr:InlB B-repeat-containing protein [Clostridiales Family XIII bacterium]